VNEASLYKRVSAAADRRLAAVLAGAIAVLAIGAGAASAQTEGGGGTIAPGDPQISDVTCLSYCIKTHKGVIGSRIRINGTDLSETRVVSLPKLDGTRAKDKDPYIKPSGAVIATVKSGAITGPVRVADTFSQIKDSDLPFKVGTEEQLRQAQAGWRFPIRGPHDYGDAMARFGAPRSGHIHQGQDVFAACGTKLVAARGGRVQYTGFQGAAGNYIVIDGRKWKYDYVYMHMRKPAIVQEGETVTTGQMVGKVGDTGDAVGCHLHFEIWTPPGWYEGGHPIDPLKTLRYWDSFS
jgi:murein DD-endopeptidase MepM/ murein hydrolase activator NlpD